VKGFDLALQGLGRLRATHPELPWVYTLVGDGPETGPLRAIAERAGIADRVTFTGALGFAAAQEQYAAAHVVIMPGVMEGWPKPVAEAWAHAAVPVAAAAGIVPWIMEGKGAGVTFTPTPDALAAALGALLSEPAAMRAMSRRGAELVGELSLESFERRLERVLVDVCGLR
jgi:glycosyltransferase involved in cell wall biosynthesis